MDPKTTYQIIIQNMAVNNNGDNIIINDHSIQWSIPLQCYQDLTCSVLTMYGILPIPTSIKFEQQPHIVFPYPDVTAVLTYDHCTLITDHPNTSELVENIKKRNAQSVCLGVTHYLLYNDKLHVPPWQISSLMPCIPQITAKNMFWSSLKCNNKPIIDVLETNHSFSASEKYSIGDALSDTTKVLMIYKLSEKSQAKLNRYSDLTYKFQDGRTHIWMNNDVVIKLNFNIRLAEHEHAILSLGLPVLPKLLDSWIDVASGEIFIVMENCGKTLQDEYVFDKLIPSHIRQQQQDIDDVLKSHGLKHLDPHRSNYVIKNDILKIIDAEVIVNVNEFEAHIAKGNDIIYIYPKEYYDTICRSEFAFMFSHTY